MCLLGIEFGRFKDFPVMVLANREEFYARPSAGPALFPRDGENPGWMGGIDLLAGGTWLGVNEFGLVVAVTNRKKSEPPANPPSRGLLCRKLLAGRETASVGEAALRELGGNRFAGCNLLIASRDSVIVIEAGDILKTTQLAPGLHLLANAELNDSLDPRIERVRQEFSDANPVSADAWFDAARHICQLTASGTAPPICLIGSDRGTVSSTVLGLGRPLQSSRYWFASGPPNSTAYEDQTPLLHQLFDAPVGQAFRPDIIERPDIEPPPDSPARRAVRQSLTCESGELHVPEPAANAPYRILLRGPWQAEALSRNESDPAHGDGRPTSNPSNLELPAPTTVRLPASWQELFGPFRGSIRFRRKFHPPSNIGACDRLAIVFDGVGGTGTVSLNSRPLGTIKPEAVTARFDVTGLLRTNNELQVDLEFTGSTAGTSPGGLYAPVVLEITAAV